jgi:hypothetical protein
VAQGDRVSHETRSFHALAHDFRVRAETEALARYLETMFSGLASSDATDIVEYELGPETLEDGTSVLQLRRDDETLIMDESAGALASRFVHHVNRVAITAEYGVMCHAGGVQLDDLGFVFPAHMESGKTTLTAGLVRAGFAYLTDEAVAFHPESGIIEPYPKPLSIDEGSHFLFPELEPAPAPGDDAAPTDQWQVPPDAIRPGAVGEPCRARFVVFNTYEDGATTELEAMSPASALLELATNTFEFRDHPRRALETLASVIEGAQSFRLKVGDLAAACELVASLPERAGARA